MKNDITKNTTVPELAAIVFQHLETNGIQAILTGGSVVTIYTDNQYESKDQLLRIHLYCERGIKAFNG